MFNYIHERFFKEQNEIQFFFDGENFGAYGQKGYYYGKESLYGFELGKGKKINLEDQKIEGKPYIKKLKTNALTNVQMNQIKNLFPLKAGNSITIIYKILVVYYHAYNGFEEAFQNIINQKADNDWYNLTFLNNFTLFQKYYKDAVQQKQFYITEIDYKKKENELINFQECDNEKPHADIFMMAQYDFDQLLPDFLPQKILTTGKQYQQINFTMEQQQYYRIDNQWPGPTNEKWVVNYYYPIIQFLQEKGCKQSACLFYKSLMDDEYWMKLVFEMFDWAALKKDEDNIQAVYTGMVEQYGKKQNTMDVPYKDKKKFDSKITAFGVLAGKITPQNADAIKQEMEVVDQDDLEQIRDCIGAVNSHVFSVKRAKQEKKEKKEKQEENLSLGDNLADSILLIDMVCNINLYGAGADADQFADQFQLSGDVDGDYLRKYCDLLKFNYRERAFQLYQYYHDKIQQLTDYDPIHHPNHKPYFRNFVQNQILFLSKIDMDNPIVSSPLILEEKKIILRDKIAVFGLSEFEKFDAAIHGDNKIPLQNFIQTDNFAADGKIHIDNNSDPNEYLYVHHRKNFIFNRNFTHIQQQNNKKKLQIKKKYDKHQYSLASDEEFDSRITWLLSQLRQEKIHDIGGKLEKDQIGNCMIIIHLIDLIMRQYTIQNKNDKEQKAELMMNILQLFLEIEGQQQIGLAYASVYLFLFVVEYKCTTRCKCGIFLNNVSSLLGLQLQYREEDVSIFQIYLQTKIDDNIQVQNQIIRYIQSLLPCIKPQINNDLFYFPKKEPFTNDYINIDGSMFTVNEFNQQYTKQKPGELPLFQDGPEFVHIFQRGQKYFLLIQICYKIINFPQFSLIPLKKKGNYFFLEQLSRKQFNYLACFASYYQIRSLYVWLANLAESKFYSLQNQNETHQLAEQHDDDEQNKLVNSPFGDIFYIAQKDKRSPVEFLQYLQENYKLQNLHNDIITPYDWQKVIVEKQISENTGHFSNIRTGAGKTSVLMQYFIQQNKYVNFAILTLKNLVDQTFKETCAFFQNGHVNVFKFTDFKGDLGKQLNDFKNQKSLKMTEDVVIDNQMQKNIYIIDYITFQKLMMTIKDGFFQGFFFFFDEMDEIFSPNYDLKLKTLDQEDKVEVDNGDIKQYLKTKCQNILYTLNDIIFGQTDQQSEKTAMIKNIINTFNSQIQSLNYGLYLSSDIMNLCDVSQNDVQKEALLTVRPMVQKMLQCFSQYDSISFQLIYSILFFYQQIYQREMGGQKDKNNYIHIQQLQGNDEIFKKKVQELFVDFQQLLKGADEDFLKNTKQVLLKTDAYFAVKQDEIIETIIDETYIQFASVFQETLQCNQYDVIKYVNDRATDWVGISGTASYCQYDLFGIAGDLGYKNTDQKIYYITGQEKIIENIFINYLYNVEIHNLDCTTDIWSQIEGNHENKKNLISKFTYGIATDKNDILVDPSGVLNKIDVYDVFTAQQTGYQNVIIMNLSNNHKINKKDKNWDNFTVMDMQQYSKSLFIFTIGTTVGVDIKGQENKVNKVSIIIKLTHNSTINTKTRDFIQGVGRSRFLHFGIKIDVYIPKYFYGTYTKSIKQSELGQYVIKGKMNVVDEDKNVSYQERFKQGFNDKILIMDEKQYGYIKEEFGEILEKHVNGETKECNLDNYYQLLEILYEHGDKEFNNSDMHYQQIFRSIFRNEQYMINKKQQVHNNAENMPLMPIDKCVIYDMKKTDNNLIQEIQNRPGVRKLTEKQTKYIKQKIGGDLNPVVQVKQQQQQQQQITIKTIDKPPTQFNKKYAQQNYSPGEGTLQSQLTEYKNESFVSIQQNQNEHSAFIQKIMQSWSTGIPSIPYMKIEWGAEKCSQYQAHTDSSNIAKIKFNIQNMAKNNFQEILVIELNVSAFKDLAPLIWGPLDEEYQEQYSKIIEKKIESVTDGDFQVLLQLIDFWGDEQVKNTSYLQDIYKKQAQLIQQDIGKKCEQITQQNAKYFEYDEQDCEVNELYQICTKMESINGKGCKNFLNLKAYYIGMQTQMEKLKKELLEKQQQNKQQTEETKTKEEVFKTEKQKMAEKYQKQQDVVGQLQMRLDGEQKNVEKIKYDHSAEKLKSGKQLEEIEKLNKEIIKVGNTNSEYHAENDKLYKKTQKYAKWLSESDEKTAKLKQTIEGQLEELDKNKLVKDAISQQLEDEIKKAEQKKTEFEQEKQTFQKTTQTHLSEIESLKNDKQKLEKQMETNYPALDEEKKTTEKQRQEIENLQKRNQSISQENIVTEKIKNRLEQENQEKIQSISKQQIEIEKQQKQIKSLEQENITSQLEQKNQLQTEKKQNIEKMGQNQNKLDKYQILAVVSGIFSILVTSISSVLGIQYFRHYKKGSINSKQDRIEKKLKKKGGVQI